MFSFFFFLTFNSYMQSMRIKQKKLLCSRVQLSILWPWVITFSLQHPDTQLSWLRDLVLDWSHSSSYTPWQHLHSYILKIRHLDGSKDICRHQCDNYRWNNIGCMRFETFLFNESYLISESSDLWMHTDIPPARNCFF